MPRQCSGACRQGSAPDGAALINTVFAQDSQESAIEQWRVVADQLREKFPKIAAPVDEAEGRVRCNKARDPLGKRTLGLNR
jgi:hypothetical protein